MTIINQLVFNFQKRTNSLTAFIYLVNVVLIALLFNKPLISLSTLFALLIMSFLVKRENILKYLRFSIVIFIVTFLFNLVLNQRGTHLLWELSFLRITQESLLNGVTFGLSFVNLLWAFYLYDALVRVKTVFELLSSVFQSIAIIFILTIQFIPRIVQLYTETKILRLFRVSQKQSGVKYTINLTENVLNKAIANFMNVSDTLILRGFHNRKKKLGKVEFQKLDGIILGILFIAIIFNLVLTTIQFPQKEIILMVTNFCLIILPILVGGMDYLWWKFYGSKTTASNIITAKNYR
ncbi:energy-coupling factor transporter transmembrane component T [Companilactobacillus alimentarius]|uniref:Uncharacterized protein n=1 Tax=Companilactobacillus alimentarius DSM 20249 TaxID=1423720 RepID=A0A2K9HE69_9LACO|nr:energy-coupling factor transporter transmembrane component T [Companilactobacillus alimentarius]AUI70851.1 hypothetical protein LA20249_00930 [Companilactobacillus alimentarius DSM 20249]KRK74953.1 hypothetical protein FC67_GL001457 [Companilactobacillus alimentarius DSM 20249]GEO44280.1 hypothetical protein LAL01_05120 [Companilactobacillus alimentarius]